MLFKYRNTIFIPTASLSKCLDIFCSLFSDRICTLVFPPHQVKLVLNDSPVFLPDHFDVHVGMLNFIMDINFSLPSAAISINSSRTPLHLEWGFHLEHDSIHCTRSLCVGLCVCICVFCYRYVCENPCMYERRASGTQGNIFTECNSVILLKIIYSCL